MGEVSQQDIPVWTGTTYAEAQSRGSTCDGAVPELLVSVYDPMLWQTSKQQTTLQLEMQIKSLGTRRRGCKIELHGNHWLALGELCNGYIAFTLLWSMITICFGIFFIVNVGEHFGDPPETLQLDSHGKAIWNRLICFNIVWLVIQGVMAVLHMGVLLNSGRITNEETRATVDTLLTSLNDFEPHHEDHLWVHQFSSKLQLQSSFGATAGRAFLLDRGSFVRFATLIVSYAIILIRFKPRTALATTALQQEAAAGDYDQGDVMP